MTITKRKVVMNTDNFHLLGQFLESPVSLSKTTAEFEEQLSANLTGEWGRGLDKMSIIDSTINSEITKAYLENDHCSSFDKLATFMNTASKLLKVNLADYAAKDLKIVFTGKLTDAISDPSVYNDPNGLARCFVGKPDISYNHIYLLAILFSPGIILGSVRVPPFLPRAEYVDDEASIVPSVFHFLDNFYLNLELSNKEFKQNAENSTDSSELLPDSGCVVVVSAVDGGKTSLNKALDVPTIIFGEVESKRLADGEIVKPPLASDLTKLMLLLGLGFYCEYIAIDSWSKKLKHNTGAASEKGIDPNFMHIANSFSRFFTQVVFLFIAPYENHFHILQNVVMQSKGTSTSVLLPVRKSGQGVSGMIVSSKENYKEQADGTITPDRRWMHFDFKSKTTKIISDARMWDISSIIYKAGMTGKNGEILS
jgi:hypothetical protein